MEITALRMVSHLFFTESLQVEFILIFFSLSFESTMKFDRMLEQYVLVLLFVPFATKERKKQMSITN